MVGLSSTTILNILQVHLGKYKVSARWLPRMLYTIQKQQRLECSIEFLGLCSHDKDEIMSRIVTEDATWVDQYEPKLNLESMQWHKNSALPPSKFNRRVTIGWYGHGDCFFGVQKGCYWSIAQKKELILQEDTMLIYLIELKATAIEKMKRNWIRGVPLLHDNALVHESHVAVAALQRCGFRTRD